MHLLYIITIIFAVIMVISVTSGFVLDAYKYKRSMKGAFASAAGSAIIAIGCGVGGMKAQEKLDKPEIDAFKADQKAKAEANAAHKLEKANTEAKKK